MVKYRGQNLDEFLDRRNEEERKEKERFEIYTERLSNLLKKKCREENYREAYNICVEIPNLLDSLTEKQIKKICIAGIELYQEQKIKNKLEKITQKN